jgi:hypothetical protein
VTRAAVLCLGLALCSCVHERTKAYTVYAATPLRDRAAPRATFERAPAPEVVSAPPAPRAAPAAPSRSPPPPPAPRDDVPARETFLSSDTEIAAGKATVHVPAALAAEATLTGGAVEDDGGGRRVATGAAVLRLRRLVVRAERVTLVERPPGEEDFQLSARQGVTFRSSQPKSVVSETDLKSLLLTNDSYVPLR